MTQQSLPPSSRLEAINLRKEVRQRVKAAKARVLRERLKKIAVVVVVVIVVGGVLIGLGGDIWAIQQLNPFQQARQIATFQAIIAANDTATVQEATKAAAKTQTSTPAPTTPSSPTSTALPPAATATIDPCANNASYRLTVITTTAVLSPPLGSFVTTSSDPLTATWTIHNTGSCPAMARFDFNIPEVFNPSTSPVLSPNGLIEPGQSAEVFLALTANEVWEQPTLNWRWRIQAQKAEGSWLDQDQPLALVLTQTWVSLLPNSTPVPTSSPTSTPVATLPPPPVITLVYPPPGDPQTGTGEEIWHGSTFPARFEWQSSQPLQADDEYYVVKIKHRDGEWYRWTKNLSYEPSTEAPLDWLINLTNNGRLRWQVLVVHTATPPEETDVPDSQATIIAESGESSFLWETE